MQQQESGQRLPPLQYNPQPQPPPQRSGLGGGGGGGMTTFVIALLVAAVVSWGMMQFMGVPKSEITAIQNTVNTFSGRMATVEGRSIPPDLSSRMADVESKTRSIPVNWVPPTTTTDTSGFLKTADLDAKLIELGYVKGGATTTTPAGTSTTTGGYTITLDHDQIISMASDTGNKDISVTVVNQTGASAVPTLLISLVPISPSTFEAIQLAAADHRNVKSTLSGFTTTQAGTVQTNPDATSLLSKLYWITPEFSLASGGSKSIWLNFDIWTTSVVTWKIEIKAL